MVKAELTADMLENGRRVLAHLRERGFPERGCFWFYFEESGRWKWVLVSPAVGTKQAFASFKRLLELIREMDENNDLLKVGNATVVAEDDPLTKLLRAARYKRRVLKDVRLTNRYAGGKPIDDAYVYRLA